MVAWGKDPLILNLLKVDLVQVFLSHLHNKKLEPKKLKNITYIQFCTQSNILQLKEDKRIGNLLTL